MNSRYKSAFIPLLMNYFTSLPPHLTQIVLQPNDSGAEFVNAVSKEESGTACTKCAGGAGICNGVGVTYCLAQPFNAIVSISKPLGDFFAFMFSIPCHPFQGTPQVLWLISAFGLSLSEGDRVFPLPGA